MAEPFIGCDQDFPSLADFVTPDQYGDYVLLRDGDVADDEALSFFIDRYSWRRITIVA